MRAFNRFKARVATAIRKNIVDPALDFIGGSQIGMFAGRSMVNSSLVATSISTGLYIPAVMITALVIFDAFILFHTLESLRSLMKYRVLEELMSNGSISLAT